MTNGEWKENGRIADRSEVDWDFRERHAEQYRNSFKMDSVSNRVVELLDKITVQLNPKKVLRQLHLGTERLEDVQELIDIAHPLIHPKIIYQVSYVTDRNENTVDIDGIRFTSRVLSVNLDGIERVFPYVMTIGRELETVATSFGNLVKQFYLETIGDIALDLVGEYFEDHLTRKYGLGKISEMNPGSLEDWPITQQENLFALLGNVEDLAGVKLTESLLMIPRKSVSGIYFPTEVTFYSCQLCLRKNCEHRQAPYDESLKDKYGI